MTHFLSALETAFCLCEVMQQIITMSKLVFMSGWHVSVIFSIHPKGHRPRNRFRYYGLGTSSILGMRHNTKNKSACASRSSYLGGPPHSQMEGHELPSSYRLLDLSESRSTNSLPRRRNQKVASLHLLVRASCPLQHRRVNTREGAVGPSSRVPRITRCTHSADQAHLRTPNINSSNVPCHLGRRATHDEPGIAVVPCRISLKRQRARISVIDEPFLEVRKRYGVADDVVRRRVIRNAEFEAVAVAFERTEAPCYLLITCYGS